MTAYSRGDVVLVDFVFTSGAGAKVRPALVISSAAYQRDRKEVIIAAITSNVSRQLYGEHALEHWREAGLVFPSTVTGIIRTILTSLIRRSLGTLDARDLANVDAALRRTLDLGQSIAGEPRRARS